MAREIRDTGRVTVFKLLHSWSPRRSAILAYTSTGHFGDTAVVGYIPFHDIPDVSLLDIAARHHPGALWQSTGAPAAGWVLCTAWSSRIVRKPGTLDLANTPWRLETDSSTEPNTPLYGHRKLLTGRFRLEEPDRMAQARTLLTAEDVPQMGVADLPAHTPF
ncbi:hypothetical protein ABZX40_25050 [Streptomyces sp. NPDC004610]|uniref:hypothetical protein n=1 Tax=unclassified Streptomyces TaxID=2593676 RepID=UPI0033B52783